jgi:hypothetical protein
LDAGTYDVTLPHDASLQAAGIVCSTDILHWVPDPGSGVTGNPDDGNNHIYYSADPRETITAKNGDVITIQVSGWYDASIGSVCTTATLTKR